MANEIAEALSTERGQGAGFQKSGVTYNEKLRSYTGGLGDATIGFLQDKYRRDKAQEDKERREQEASDELRGKVLAEGGQELPEDASDATKQSYNASQFIKNSSKAVKEAITSFDSEDFMELSAEKQDENVQVLKDGLLNSVAGTGVEDNEGVQKYLIAQMQAIDIGVANTRHNYKNVVLPTRTVGNKIDMLIESNADEATFGSFIEGFYDETTRGKMPREDMDKLVYGEVVRATESGNLNAYPALKNSSVYENMSSKQKMMLERSYEQEIVSNRNHTINNLTASYRDGINSVLETGDITVLDDIEKQLQQLPPEYSEPIRAKLDSAMKKVLPTRNALTRGFQRAAGDREVSLTPDQSSTFYDYTTREIMNDGGGQVGLQESKQIASMQLSNIGIFTEDTQDAYDLQNVSFVDGQLDARSVRSIDGANKLNQAGTPRRDMERIMGAKNYNVWAQARTFMEQGLDQNLAMSRAVEVNTKYADSPAFEKARKKIADIETINQAGFFETLFDTAGDVLSVITPNTPRFLESTFEAEQSDELELFTRAPVTDSGMELGDSLTGGAIERLESENTTKLTSAYLEYQKKYPAQDTKTQLREFKRMMEEDAIIANGNLILNERLGDRMRQVSGSQTQANKHISLAAQALTPFMVLPQEERQAVQDSVIDIKIRQEDGTYKTIEDADERARAFSTKQFRDSDMIRLDLNREAYDKLYSEGGTLRDGRKIKPLRNRISRMAGWYDTREMGREFIQHTLDYDENTRSFIMKGMNQSGEQLTNDKPIIRKQVVDGEVREITEVEADAPIMGTIPEDLMLLFMRSYAKQGE